ncbi:peroxidase 2 [Zea mays]|uniref:Peroxidase n=1 Tax=Zea mays TaxID=4577 RepID=K7U151_MAIZE|nr:peroxidase 2 [Zea mays]AQK41941.1 Peroxidase 64 [Zea mays]|eukprot:XP_008662923.1 peroxidase 2 [Zea mays]
MAATSSAALVTMVVVIAAAAISTASGTALLQYNFYGSSCPKAEEAVRNATQKIISDDPTMGAAFVRLFFHDCFVRGCDASILLDQSNSNPQPEKLAIPLRGYAQVNTIKAAVEAVCPGVVSCADILAYAARDSAAASGGFAFAMPGGRRDGSVSNLNDIPGNLPAPNMQVQDLIASFGSKGLSAADLVALSGAHSFGQTHCSFVTPRLYPAVDATMNATFAAALKAVCPPPSQGGGGTVLNNNRVTDPNKLSNQYYTNLATGQVMFTSDQTLTSSNTTNKMVQDNAADPIAWMARFAGAMLKMGGIQVLTGTQGEIRRVCGATNGGN